MGLSADIYVPATRERKLRPNSVRLSGCPIFFVEFSTDGGVTWNLGMTQSVARTRRSAREQGWLIRIPKTTVAPRFG